MCAKLKAPPEGTVRTEDAQDGFKTTQDCPAPRKPMNAPRRAPKKGPRGQHEKCPCMCQRLSRGRALAGLPNYRVHPK
eukprot:6673979-Pyramimonas_sp.AAC.1